MLPVLLRLMLETAGSNDVDEKASLEGANQASSDDDNINNEAFSRT